MERESTTSIVTAGEGGRADQRREARPRRQGKVEEGCEWLARYYMYIKCSVGTCTSVKSSGDDKQQQAAIRERGRAGESRGGSRAYWPGRGKHDMAKLGTRGYRGGAGSGMCII